MAFKDGIVVRQHHRLGLSGGARGVDENGALTRLHRIRARVHFCVALLATELHHGFPAQNRHLAALQVHLLSCRGLIAVGHKGFDPGRLRIRPCSKGLHQLVQLPLVLNDDNSSAAVRDFIGGGLWGVGGVEAPSHSAGHARSEGAEHPLRGVEAPHGHVVEGLQPQLDEPLGCLPRCVVVLLPSPRGPLLVRQRRRGLPLGVQRWQGTLDLERWHVALRFSSLLQRQGERGRLAALPAGSAHLGKALHVKAIWFAGPPRPTLRVVAVLVWVLRDRSLFQHLR
mmetsp:Transcript_15448/g.36505  ORF Transcript_15448/g.36505 Transcript_15448/m.36505 type:complete len:283 (-) Transcript_15448:61-909(-)